MSLLDDLDAARPMPLGVQCMVARAADQHPDIAGDILVAVMRRDRPAQVISDVLAKHGVEVSQGVIQRHRRKECKCHS